MPIARSHTSPTRLTPALALGAAMLAAAPVAYADENVGSNRSSAATAGTSGVSFSSRRNVSVSSTAGVSGGSATVGRSSASESTGGKAAPTPQPRGIDSNCVVGKQKVRDILVSETPGDLPVSATTPETFAMFGRAPESFLFVNTIPETFTMFGRIPESFPISGRIAVRDQISGESAMKERVSGKTTGNDYLSSIEPDFCPHPSKLVFPGSDLEADEASDAGTDVHANHSHHH